MRRKNEWQRKRVLSIDSISWLDICLIEHEIFHYMVNAIEGFWFIFFVRAWAIKSTTADFEGIMPLCSKAKVKCY